MNLNCAKKSFFESLAGRLTGLQARSHALIALAILLITANTVFLLVRRLGLGCAIGGESRCTISQFYQLMVLSHSGIGILITAAISAFLIWHLVDHWALARRRGRSLASGLGLLILTFFLLQIGGWSCPRGHHQAVATAQGLHKLRQPAKVQAPNIAMGQGRGQLRGWPHQQPHSLATGQRFFGNTKSRPAAGAADGKNVAVHCV